MTKVLLTGGSGFIAAHCLRQLLTAGHHVVTTVRSQEKAQLIRQAHQDLAERLEVSIVPDIAKDDAFNEVVKTPGIDLVLHVASPFHYNFTDPQKELIDPALQGTTGLLKSLATVPTIRRVVVTSSFAAVLDEKRLDDPSWTFTEESWNPVGVADMHSSKVTAYRLSKKLAEKASWDFVAQNKPGFDLVTICPPLVMGPVEHHIASLEQINTSNKEVINFLRGNYKEEYPAMPPIDAYIDVRDLANIHIQALEKKEAVGKRLLTIAGRYNLRELVQAIKARFPEYQDRLPSDDVKGGVSLGPKFQFDAAKTDDILGIKYRTIDESIGDLVASLKPYNI